ncbi:glucose-6-phosphate dehydrogenase [Paenibacillus sp. IB182496]|uniref:Glucose-6-phosphate 1-dehydrogenase n=1 Tax=Paenibacillus sabuli TaxID=2772509 RepID=A0A927GPS2_9BACL|nr:glucose-6-phosphate dehydrogenase [Paenibacillus sabuli]MBD2843618.1 glucose-6-phosphate dehydrogenase [Paenibacillus sabuli]
MNAASFVLFGATGDLAKRKIYPALYNLFVDGKLSEGFSVVGLGRRAWSDETFQANVEQALYDFSRRKPADRGELARFVRAFRFQVLDIDRAEDYAQLRELVERRERELGLTPNRMFYLSVGPEYFGTIANHIEASGLGGADGWKRLVIEKPFGHDLASARALNAKLGETFAEEEIYRIDHYLGKPMVQKLELLQQSNPVLQALWSNHYIANVQITASETVGVETRAGYYDRAGAIRDMFQNHMLQLLMMLTAQLPKNSTAETVRFKKKKVMEALDPLQQGQVAASVVRGQYAAGAIAGVPVAGYADEPGIPAGSTNDTYVAARLTIDDAFWRGVPFYIRTGKRLQAKSTRIVIEFKPPLKQSGADAAQPPNLLIIDINPNETITLQLNARDTQDKARFRPLHLDLRDDAEETPEAYENLIGDALRGDATFFAHWDEVELSWRWVQPILEAFADGEVPLHPYEAGGHGPAAADALTARDGYRWWQGEDEARAAETERAQAEIPQEHAVQEHTKRAGERQYV